VLVEPHHLRARARRELADHLIARVKDGKIVRTRELDSARLEVDVALECAVALEMVGGDVEDHAHMEARPLDGLELEGGELEHHPVVSCDLVEPVEHRVADVAADDHRPVSCGQHVAGERGGGRLAVGAGDTHHRSRAELEKEVDLARDRDAARASVIQKR